MPVYIVRGETGEYEDRKDWPVAAYFEESEAAKHVALAEARLKELGLESETGARYFDSDYRDSVVFGPLDPGFQCDYTGTRYFFETVVTYDTVPATEGEQA